MMDSICLLANIHRDVNKRVFFLLFQGYQFLINAQFILENLGMCPLDDPFFVY